MEENPLTKQLEELAGTLRKYSYDIIIRNHDWILEAKLKKPNLLIILIAILLGMVHISQQKMVLGILDFMFAIAFMFMAYFANKKYELLNTDIDHILIAADGITVYFKNKKSVQYSADQIESLAVDVQYLGNNSIVSILLLQRNGGPQKLVCMMSKKENAVIATAEKIVSLTTSTVHLNSSSPLDPLTA